VPDPASSPVDDEIEKEKQLAAESAAELIKPGMLVGLGTGSTVAYLIPALAQRQLDITCVATSPGTQARAEEAGLRVMPFDHIDHLDIAIDGSDQVDSQHWLIKGGGGAHTREKIVAAAAERFVVIVSSNKLVDRLHAPVPVELSPFGLAALLRRRPDITLRHGAPPTPDGGVLADYTGPVDDAALLAADLGATAGIVAHGLFPPSMVTTVLVGHHPHVTSTTPAIPPT
jgi:ribose 5-phosphate isomerase A